MTDYFLIALAGVIAAVNVALFLAPHKIAPGGVSGLAILINALTGWRIGLVMLCFNIPLLAIGFRMLGRWRFLWRSLVYTLIASPGVDIVAQCIAAVRPQHCSPPSTTRRSASCATWWRQSTPTPFW